MPPLPPDPTLSNFEGRLYGRSGDVCKEAPNRRHRIATRHAFRPLPGLQAYKLSAGGRGEGSAVPGFRARTYRDLGQEGYSRRPRNVTGISGMHLPGFEAWDYRESGHGDAGTWGTNEHATTGILGMNRPRNALALLGFGDRNFVSNNSCNNTSTGGDICLAEVRGTCPRRE